MFSARVKLMRSHLIALTISKLIWRKVLRLLTECTHSLNQSSTHSVPLLRNMSILGSSAPWNLCTGLWSYSLRKRTVAFGFASITAASIASLKRPLPLTPPNWPPRHTKESLRIHQNRPLACLSSCSDCRRRGMESYFPHSLWFIWMDGNAFWTH